MKLPGDIVVLESTDLATDEAALTGEPESIEKFAVNLNNIDYNPNPFLLAKTLVV